MASFRVNKHIASHLTNPRYRCLHLKYAFTIFFVLLFAVAQLTQQVFNTRAALSWQTSESLIIAEVSSFSVQLALNRSSTEADVFWRDANTVSLEEAVNADRELGVCHSEDSFLLEVPEHACRTFHCLWSSATEFNVDIWFSPLGTVSSTRAAERCPLPSGGQLPLRAGQTPQISFVLQTGGSADAACQALFELFRTANEAESAEYIIVSSGWGQGREAKVLQVAQTLQDLFGVKILTVAYPDMTEYGAARNAGAMAAIGEYVVFVDNSKYFARGWLSTLLVTFQQQPSAGVLGPLLLNHAGLVEEAGGMVFHHGQTAQYGHKRSAAHHIYKYLREVDSVSGGCMAVRRSLFLSLGGFDSQFTLAQYAAADLGMAVREAGFKVLLQPLAVAHHEEERAVDPSSWARLEDEDRRKLKSKWRYRLRKQHCSVDKAQPWEAAGRLQSPRVLWVDSSVPEPDRDSGSLRSMSIMRILLNEGYHITHLPAYDISSNLAAYAARARFLGLDVVTPITKQDSWNFLDEHGRCKFDVIVAARWGLYADVIGYFKRDCPQVPIIFDTVDLHFVREARLAMTAQERQANDTAAPTRAGFNEEVQSWDMDSLSMSSVLEFLRPGGPAPELLRRQYEAELKLVSLSDVTLVVSDAEVELLHQFHPNAEVTVVSNVHEVPHPQLMGSHTYKRRSGLLFIGSLSHQPNTQAVEEMVTRVLPALMEHLPVEHAKGLILHVVGAGTLPAHLQELVARRKNVKFHGYLPDDLLEMLYGSVKVVVAPLLVGAGVKGKVNQAMNQGVPVVATPVAVEGMSLEDGRDCLLASSPQEFAAKVAQVYTDCTLWSRLVEGGYRNMRQHFSWEVARKNVFKAFEKVGMGPLPPSQRGQCRSRRAF